MNWEEERVNRTDISCWSIEIGNILFDFKKVPKKGMLFPLLRDDYIYQRYFDSASNEEVIKWKKRKKDA